MPRALPLTPAHSDTAVRAGRSRRAVGGSGPATALTAVTVTGTAGVASAAPSPLAPLPAIPQGPRVVSALRTPAFAGLGLATGVVLFVRLYGLGDLVPGLHRAEAAYVRAAEKITEQGGIGLWPEVIHAQPAGYAYWMAAWMSVFGEPAAILKLGSAVVGLATLAVFYLFCRSLFGTRAAVFSTVLLGLGVWHLHYSRLTMPVGALLVLELTAAYLLLTALRSRGGWPRQRLLLALAGLAFGASVYLHNASFIFAVVVAAVWTREFLAGERPLVALRRSGLAFFVPAVALALPYFVSLALNPGAVSGQVRSVAVTSEAEFEDLPGVMEEIRHIMANGGWTGAALLGSRDPRRAEGQVVARRLVDPVTGLLGALGLLAGLWRWRQRRHFILLALILATVVAVSLTGDSGAYGRLAVAMPAVFAYAGYALHWLLVWARGRLTDRAAYAVVAALVVLAAAHNVASFYAHPVGPTEAAWAAFRD